MPCSGCAGRGAAAIGCATGAGAGADDTAASGLGMAAPAGRPTDVFTRSRKPVESNGFWMWPLAPTACARAASKGSKVPDSNSTGMCAVEGSDFSSWQTS